MTHKKTILEYIFGDDIQYLRKFSRRILSFLVSIIPFKQARRKLRDKIDLLLIKLHNRKIEYFLKNYPHIINAKRTMRMLAQGYSFSRFGDGEYNLLLNIHKKAFQRLDDRLTDKMREVLKSDDKKILIGLSSAKDRDHIGVIWKKFIVRKGNRTLNLFEKGRSYHSASFTEVLLTTKGKEFEDNVNLIKKIWQDRKVLFVTGGPQSRFFYLDELFGNCQCHEFYDAPAKNAFAEYDRIIDEINEKYDKEWLILMSLGPTATVMAYDLAKMGYHAIDLGQIPSIYHKNKYGTRYPEDHHMAQMLEGKKSMF